MSTEEALAEEPFESTMAELERIVACLEGGELPLEAALKAFEQGVALAQRLSRRLTEAESRIDVLTRNASGAAEIYPFEPDSSDE